jgi:arginase
VALKEIKQDPEGAARQALAWSEKFERLLVHLDIDVMAFTRFPLAENIRYEGRHAGLDLSELAAVLDVVLAAPNWRALTLTEVNPDHAPDEAVAFAELIGVLSHALGSRFE